MKRSIAIVALAAAGCGGGVVIGFGDGGFDDGRAPSVSIATAQASVAPGGTLRVVAAAADDSGIDGVAFYRRDGGSWVLLGEDRREPWDFDVPVPADGRSQVEVRARATDRGGLEADSNVLAVPVIR
jgi:hypothetical protein